MSSKAEGVFGASWVCLARSSLSLLLLSNLLILLLLFVSLARAEQIRMTKRICEAE